MITQSTAPNLAQRTPVRVEYSGELVVLKINNLPIAMHFSHALSWSAEILGVARVVGIPRRQGPRVAGILQNEGTMRGISSVGLPQTTKREALGAEPLGHQVRLKIGKLCADMSAEAAAQIAQWLRINGKMARNTVNEKASWGEIAEANRVIENVKDRLQ